MRYIVYETQDDGSEVIISKHMKMDTAMRQMRRYKMMGIDAKLKELF